MACKQLILQYNLGETLFDLPKEPTALEAYLSLLIWLKVNQQIQYVN